MTLVSRSILTLLSMANDGKGPAQTCVNLMNGAVQGGYSVRLYATRQRSRTSNIPTVLSLPKPLSILPYGKVRNAAKKRIEQRFLSEIREGDIAYLWPSVSIETQKILFQRGHPIVLEGINTRMKSAKKILDSAYEEFGIPPAHNITNRRIDEEEEKYLYANAIFAPNREVERALSGSSLERSIIPASYGVDITRASTQRSYQEKKSLTILFVGYACIRKGAHYLIEAFTKMKGAHRLRFVGNIEPAISERYADILASDKVETTGFLQDPHSEFSSADIFVMPSLEEGGPQVTYEAGIHGLPIIASAMGMGRLGEHEGSMIIVDPSDTESFCAELERICEDPELRRNLGQRVHKLSELYDWNRIGAMRAADLHARLQTH